MSVIRKGNAFSFENRRAGFVRLRQKCGMCPLAYATSTKKRMLFTDRSWFDATPMKNLSRSSSWLALPGARLLAANVAIPSGRQRQLPAGRQTPAVISGNALRPFPASAGGRLKWPGRGLNTIATYVFWNYHEPAKGKYNFTGNRGCGAFVRMAGEEGSGSLSVQPLCVRGVGFGGYPVAA